METHLLKSRSKEFEYDVCLSFAGEDRKYVEQVADHLHGRGVRVFYDRHETVNLWGKDLYEYLADIYSNKAKYCVLFASRWYREKLWTNHERRNAQARAFRANQEYILPARFDATAIPGVPETVGYVDLRNVKSNQLAKLIEDKIGPIFAENYFPDEPIGLFSALGIRSKSQKELLKNWSRWVMSQLKHLRPEERFAVFLIFLHGCTAALPKNMHISADLLSRISGMRVSKLQRTLKGISSLGFHFSEYIDDECHSDCERMFAIEFHDRRRDGLGNSTGYLDTIIDLVRRKCCASCGVQSLMRLDFTATALKQRKLRTPDGAEV